MTSAYNLSQLANKVNTSGQLDASTGLVNTTPVANGGTGASTLTANNVLLGNGTSALQTVAPSTSGNVLTSNGTTWVSQALPALGVSSFFGATGAVGAGTATSGSTYTVFSTDTNGIVAHNNASYPDWTDGTYDTFVYNIVCGTVSYGSAAGILLGQLSLIALNTGVYTITFNQRTTGIASATGNSRILVDGTQIWTAGISGSNVTTARSVDVTISSPFSILTFQSNRTAGSGSLGISLLKIRSATTVNGAGFIKRGL